MKIYLIRHGRQNSRLCNVDVDLAEEGKQQARLVAERIKNWNIEKIYCSDLKRAMETAAIINETLNVNIVVESQLREIDFGEMTGHSDEENAKYFAFFQKKLKSRRCDLAYPGGECGADVYQRGFPVINKIVHGSTGNVAIVTHGGFIRCILAGILGMDFAKKSMFGKNMENTSITELDYDTDSEMFTLERFNDYTHLEGKPELLRSSWK